MDLQRSKAVVRDYYDAIARAAPDTLLATMEARLNPDYHWRGMHPFDELHGPQAVHDAFLAPFLASFRSVQRRQDVFMAGLNEIDQGASTWVCSMGHLMGLFDKPWLGIPANRKIAVLRYAEFHRVKGGRIAETAFFFDLIHLMQQVGLQVLPPQTGASLVQPGPMTHDGLLFEAQDPIEGKATIDLINRMRVDLNAGHLFKTPRDELSRTWHEDMIWWGPGGIGATYTIDRYIEQHQQPFKVHLKDRKFNGHLCRFAEGRFGGFFGWPNLTLTPCGGFMGLPATETPADMRVVDIYRRDGDKLAENWIFIDILHFLKMQGLDVLSRNQSLMNTTSVLA